MLASISSAWLLRRHPSHSKRKARKIRKGSSVRLVGVQVRRTRFARSFLPLRGSLMVPSKLSGIAMALMVKSRRDRSSARAATEGSQVISTLPNSLWKRK